MALSLIAKRNILPTAHRFVSTTVKNEDKAKSSGMFK